MWRWVVVLAMSVALPTGWTQAAWSQDVGTPACRDAQLLVQGEVGDQTNPPFTNHGEYVRAAAHAANPSLDSGEITETCHECIVSQFAQSIPVADQQTCGPDMPALCMPGAEGWKDEVYSGGEGEMYLPGNAATPAACCQLCLDTENCLQWVFFGSLGSCVLNSNPANQCMGSLISVTDFSATDGGMIRCQQ